MITDVATNHPHPDDNALFPALVLMEDRDPWKVQDGHGPSAPALTGSNRLPAVSKSPGKAI